MANKKNPLYQQYRTRTLGEEEYRSLKMFERIKVREHHAKEYCQRYLLKPEEPNRGSMWHNILDDAISIRKANVVLETKVRQLERRIQILGDPGLAFAFARMERVLSGEGEPERASV